MDPKGIKGAKGNTGVLFYGRYEGCFENTCFGTSHKKLFRLDKLRGVDIILMLPWILRTRASIVLQYYIDFASPAGCS